MKASTLFLLLLAGGLRWGLPTAVAQTLYTAMPVTGFTDDVVVNGPGPAARSATNPVDQGIPNLRYCYAAPDYRSFLGLSPATALPANGFISSAQTPGLTFQLGPYAGLNALRIAGTGTGALTLTAPQAATDVYVLAACGNGDSPVSITVTFTDQTSQTFSAVVHDWFGGGSFALKGVSRVNFDTNAIENNADDPRMYEVRLPLAPANASKPVQRLTFAKTSAGPAPILNVLGVSLGRACSLPGGSLQASGPTSICPGQAVPLHVVVLGIGSTFSLQWQVSTDNGVTWTDIAGATLPTYTATPLMSTQYRLRGTCDATTRYFGPLAVTVLAPPTALAFAQPNVCQAAAHGPAATFAPPGGTFSAPAGLAIDAATGAISPTASSVGTYVVTYATTAGPCPGVATASLTVTPLLPGAVAYPSGGFCRAGANPTPAATPGGGVFSGSGGLVIDSVSGTIDLGRTPAGTYRVTYAGAGGCSSPATAQVVLTDPPALVFPNVITPGPDQYNRALRFGITTGQGYALQVFSRWGRLVWESHNPAEGWTAENNSPGPYFYRVEYQDCAGRRQEYRGWVEVIK